MLVVAVGNRKWEQAGRIGSTGGARRDRMLVVTVGNRELANEYVSSGEMKERKHQPMRDWPAKKGSTRNQVESVGLALLTELKAERVDADRARESSRAGVHGTLYWHSKELSTGIVRQNIMWVLAVGSWNPG